MRNKEILLLKDISKFLHAIGPDINLDFILDLELTSAIDICDLGDKLDKLIQKERNYK